MGDRTNRRIRSRERKKGEEDLPVYWHPLLAQFLERELGHQIRVEAEVPLGEMPLRVDLLLKPLAGVSVAELPYPFCFLGTTTLVEYVGPEETATEEDLERLEIYGLLFRRHHRLKTRTEVTLWLIASRFAADASNLEGAYLEDLTELGSGVRKGTLDRFPVFLIELERLPLNEATLPLLMVHKGKREQELMGFIVEHRQRYHYYLLLAMTMHLKALQEVLAMQQMDLEELGLDIDAAIDFLGRDRLIRKIGVENFIRAVGVENLIRAVGVENLIRAVGVENLIRAVGVENLIRAIEDFIRATRAENPVRAASIEQALQELVRLLGKERVRQMLDEMPDTSENQPTTLSETSEHSE